MNNWRNILSRTEYACTTGTLGSVQSTVNYTYGDSAWGDLLTGYNGKTITSDTIGNMLSDGTWTYNWEHGRELATMSNGSTTWTNTYNADGLRTKRATGSTIGVIGAVGGEDSATINDFIVGYKQGAQYANPDIDVQVQYSNTYDDPAVGKECALTLNEKGADVVFQIASKCGDGVFEAAKEKGFYAIGVDSDQKYIDPEVIICSMCKNVGDSIYDAVNQYVAKGDDCGLWGTTWLADMKTGYVGIGYGEEGAPQQVSDDVKAEVEALTQKIVSGEIQVDSTR